MEKIITRREKCRKVESKRPLHYQSATVGEKQMIMVTIKIISLTFPTVIKMLVANTFVRGIVLGRKISIHLNCDG
jgi:hypothetical protein